VLGLLPEAVDSLTVPELRRLALARGRERHFEAARLRWLVITLSEVVRHGVAVGYRQAKSDRRLPESDLEKRLDLVPGWDRKAARVRAGVRSR